MAFDRKAYMKRWNAEHREHKRALQKKYYRENPAKYRRRSRAYKAANKEKVSAYNHNYWEKNREALREKRRPLQLEYRRNHKEEHNKSSAEQRRKFPEKIRARSITNHAIRKGEIVRQPCEICGRTDVQAHHDNYNEPLKIRWLCVTCHNEWHRINKKRAEKGLKNGNT